MDKCLNSLPLTALLVRATEEQGAKERPMLEGIFSYERLCKDAQRLLQRAKFLGETEDPLALRRWGQLLRIENRYPQLLQPCDDLRVDGFKALRWGRLRCLSIQPWLRLVHMAKYLPLHMLR
jgi:hypothetical protein